MPGDKTAVVPVEPEAQEKVYVPNAKNPPDAIWIGPEHPACHSQSRTGKLAGVLFGMKPGEVRVHVPLAMVNGGRLVKRNPTDPGYYWPSDHESHHTERHDWFPVQGRDGVRAGFLKPEPADED